MQDLALRDDVGRHRMGPYRRLYDRLQRLHPTPCWGSTARSPCWSTVARRPHSTPSTRSTYRLSADPFEYKRRGARGSRASGDGPGVGRARNAARSKTSASSFGVRAPTGVAVSSDPFRLVHRPQCGQPQARAGGEDRDSAGSHKEPEHDENDAQQHLSLEELDDPSDDEDHSEYPQDGCHGPARTRQLMARYGSPHE